MHRDACPYRFKQVDFFVAIASIYSLIGICGLNSGCVHGTYTQLYLLPFMSPIYRNEQIELEQEFVSYQLFAENVWTNAKVESDAESYYRMDLIS